MERTLKTLRKELKGDIYILLRNAEIGQRFLQDAESEGFTVGGNRPTTKPYATVMALRDGTISYAGTNGMIRFQCGDTNDFHRIDYAKYVSGAEDYRFREDGAK